MLKKFLKIDEWTGHGRVCIIIALIAVVVIVSCFSIGWWNQRIHSMVLKMNK